MERHLRRVIRTAMITPKTSPYLTIGCVIATVVILLSLRNYGTVSSAASQWNYSGQPSPKRPLDGNFNSASSARRREIDTTSEIGRASNATLGVLVLGLPERSDKRDALVLSASLTGFDVNFMDAMRGDNFSDKARPPGMNLQGGAVGSWRSHLNAIRSVIENNLASAFIMEDDVDWDVRLLTQTPHLAIGVRSLSNIPISENQYSPYGDEWDVLWPGHCGEVLPRNDDRRYIIENDETAAPKAHQPWLKGLKDLPEHTRMVHKTGAPMCTFGYAVSYRGAQKIIMALGVKAGANLAFDNGLGFLCRDGYLDIKCFSIEPQLFQHHRPAGSVDRDSDIIANPHAVVRKQGVTDFIELSARLNLEQLITGSTDYTRQW